MNREKRLPSGLTVRLYKIGDLQFWGTQHTNLRDYRASHGKEKIKIAAGPGGIVFYADFDPHNPENVPNEDEAPRRAYVHPAAILENQTLVLAGAQVGARVVLAHFYGKNEEPDRRGIIGSDCTVGGIIEGEDLWLADPKTECDTVIHGCEIGSHSLINRRTIPGTNLYANPMNLMDENRSTIYVASSLPPHSLLKSDGIQANIFIGRGVSVGTDVRMEVKNDSTTWPSSIKILKGSEIGDRSILSADGGLHGGSLILVDGPKVGRGAQIYTQPRTMCVVGDFAQNPETRLTAQVGEEAYIKLGQEGKWSSTSLVIQGKVADRTRIEIEEGDHAIWPEQTVEGYAKVCGFVLELRPAAPPANIPAAPSSRKLEAEGRGMG